MLKKIEEKISKETERVNKEIEQGTETFAKLTTKLNEIDKMEEQKLKLLNMLDPIYRRLFAKTLETCERIRTLKHVFCIQGLK